MTPLLPFWVCAEPVDYRLGIDGLALKVQANLGPQQASASSAAQRLRC